ncbi:SART-1 family protein DOT2 isoform X2 [Andrographis paniculata]|uniref:SART-1 family protein DOT2 isoform X2 n=1 Tax=Andrographis paniculata TaxID=175694 RepID=UPI0021E72E97|nr:SART-1 family protein DOT2 isoform X2 [Andrographis paniculata]
MGADLVENRRARSVETRDQDDASMRDRWHGEHADLEGNESDEPRDSGKHRAKDKSKSSGRREDKEHRSRDLERPREREKDNKDSEKDRRDRRKEDRDERDKEKVRDRAREREADREKHREKEKDKERKDRVKEKERDKEREKELEKDGEKGHGKERGKEKSSRDKDKDREKERERPKDRDREKHKERERERDRGKDTTEREKGKERTRDKERQADLEKDVGRDTEKSSRKQKDETHKRDKEMENDYSHNNQSTKVSGSRRTASELEDRISKMKEERLKKSAEGASEVLSWVNRSRQLEEKMNAEKEKALQLSKIFEEQDNMNEEESDDEATDQQTAHDLSGVRVLHGLDKVLEGGAVVLTLKDQSILADGDVNQEVDMLENVELGEQKRRDDAYKAAKKKTGVYDDKFNDEPGSEKKMLPQYDDPVTDEGVTLDSTGRISSDAEKKLEELRKRIKGVSASNNVVDLTSSGKISSDYYTQEEMTKFKKPKKKKSLRKKDKLDISALEAEAISAGLGAGDLGSRKDGKRSSLREEQDKLEAEMRSNAYESAYAKADEASKALRREQVRTEQTEDDDNPALGDDDDELRKALERARKKALKKQNEEENSAKFIIQLANSTANESKADDQNVTSGEQQENTVVFTEMDEFVWGLQHDEEEKKPESEDVFMEEDVVPSTSDQEMKEEDEDQTQMDETMKDETPAKEEDEEVVPDEAIHEAAVGKGLAGALKLLKDRGTLKETVEWGGRNMDKKKSKLVGIYDNDGSKEIRIERTDEYGRILTPKEAFRLLSHKFHGKGPGKMKQEKRMRQYQEELKIKQMKNADTPSLSVERMREVQAKQQTPYLVLSGHVKPGQSSDPRSGFATVEKDFAGGLTPMLGDKKVEHFLNIKRKPEAGDGASQKKPKT